MAENDSIEEWRAIPGYDGAYEVSSHRRVRSPDRCNRRGSILALRGGSKFKLRRNNARCEVSIHRLMDDIFPELQDAPFPDTADEQWRNVVGYEGMYRVSSIGRVLSLARTRADDHFVKQKVLGVVTHNGYRTVMLHDGRRETISRLMAAAFLGYKSGDYVDHADRNRSNDSLNNLRIATATQNLCNQIRKNKSGIGGVDWLVREQRWRVRVSISHQTHTIGYFRSKDEAVKARNEAVKRLHGDFACLQKGAG